MSQVADAETRAASHFVVLQQHAQRKDIQEKKAAALQIRLPIIFLIEICADQNSHIAAHSNLTPSLNCQPAKGLGIFGISR